MTHYTVTVPVKGKDDRTRYRRVGAMFENRNAETGEVFYTVRLDFPVGATELLAFPTKGSPALAAAGADAEEAAVVARDAADGNPATAVAAGGRT